MYADNLAYVHHTGFADLARGAAPFLVQELARLCPRGGEIVDLGCGSGLLARALVDAGHDVTGVDLSPAMLAIARTHAARARFVEASLYDVDAWARPGGVDAVLAVGEPLSYLEPTSARAPSRPRTPALAPFFRKVARALRPGGAFVFDVIVSGAPSLTKRSFVEGDGWAVLVDTRERSSKDGRRARLTRDITTFTRASGARSHEWTRGHERHEVRVLDVEDVKRDLARAGFSVRVRRAYGTHALAVRRRAFLCRRL